MEKMRVDEEKMRACKHSFQKMRQKQEGKSTKEDGPVNNCFVISQQ